MRLAGTVTADREAIVRLRLRGANGLEIDIDVVVDTGFTQSLTLPTAWVSALALPPIRSEEADGAYLTPETIFSHIVSAAQVTALVSPT